MDCALGVAGAAGSIEYERGCIGGWGYKERCTQRLSFRPSEQSCVDSSELARTRTLMTTDDQYLFEIPQSPACICQQSVAEISFDDCRARSAVAQNLFLLVSSQPHVYRHRDRAERLNGNKRSDEFRRVIEENGYAISVLKAQRVQCFRGANRLFAQLAIGDFALLVKHRDSRITTLGKDGSEEC